MSSQRLVTAVMVAFGCLWVWPAVAAACSCVPQSPCQALSRRDARPNVFEATVESLEHRPISQGMVNGEPLISSGTTIVHLKDVRSLLGDSATTIVTSGDGASCGYSFAVGQRYVIDAYANGGQLGTGACSQTRPIEEAGQLLAYVASLSRPSRGGLVTGTVLLSTLEYSFSPASRPRGIEGVGITLEGPVSLRASTRADGGFSFEGVPSGRYRIAALPPAAMSYISAPQPFDVNIPDAHACADVPFSLTLNATIEGSVVDRDGTPVKNASVALRRTDALTAPPIPNFTYFVGYARTRTDDAGHYEFRSVPPGQYVAGLNIDSGSAAGSAYRAAYVAMLDGSPDVIDFPLGGHRLLPPIVAVPPSYVVVTGRVAWPDARPGAGMKIVAYAHGESLKSIGAQVETRADAEGRFSLRLPEGVAHTVRAFIDADTVRTQDDYRISAKLDIVAAPGEIALVLTRER